MGLRKKFKKKYKKYKNKAKKTVKRVTHAPKDAVNAVAKAPGAAMDQFEKLNNKVAGAAKSQFDKVTGGVLNQPDMPDYQSPAMVDSGPLAPKSSLNPAADTAQQAVSRQSFIRNTLGETGNNGKKRKRLGA